jgi:hypothetical protein
MVSVSVRSLLVPAVAAVAAGAVALGPAVVAPPAVTLAQPTVAVPSVHIEDIQLAGIGRDFYNWVNSGVAPTVAWASVGISLIPFIGPPISDQIDINYALIESVISNSVYYLSDVFADPFGFPYYTGVYGSQLFYAGYQWVNGQAAFFGLPPLPWIPVPPPLASANASSAPLAAARTARGPRAAAAVAELPAAVAADAVAEDPTEAPAPARAARGDLRRAARNAVVGAAQSARAAAADVPAAVQQADDEVSAAAPAAVTEVRSTARAPRAAKAPREARGAVRAAADAVN